MAHVEPSKLIYPRTFVFAYTYKKERLSRNARKPRNLFKTGKGMKEKEDVQVNI